MTVLAEWYASAPTDEMVIQTLTFNVPGLPLLRLCNGFTDYTLGVGGVPTLFTASPLSLSLPSKNTTGQQTLSFGFSGVNGEAQRYVEAALLSTTPSTLTYAEYFLSDLSQPASNPLTADVVGGVFDWADATFEASYYDILNTAWPRDRYTVEEAPGLKWL